MSDHPSLKDILARQRAEKERLAHQQKLDAEAESRRRELLDLFERMRYCQQGFLPPGADPYVEFARRLTALANRLSERSELESLLGRVRDVPAGADSTERDARLFVADLLTLGKDGQNQDVAQAVRETAGLPPLFQYRVNDWLSRRLQELFFSSEPAPAQHRTDPASIASAPLVIGGCRVLRDATPEDLKGGPPPACGRFVVVWDGCSESERIALLWEDADGTPTLETGTDGLTVLGNPARATWLPEGWRMHHYPTGLSLANLEHWFRCILDNAHYDKFAVGPEFGESSCPTVRGMVAHAYMIVRHYGFPDSPKEPQQPLDREGYVTNLREVLHFLRFHLDRNCQPPTGPDALSALDRRERPVVLDPVARMRQECAGRRPALVLMHQTDCPISPTSWQREVDDLWERWAFYLPPECPPPPRPVVADYRQASEAVNELLRALNHIAGPPSAPPISLPRPPAPTPSVTTLGDADRQEEAGPLAAVSEAPTPANPSTPPTPHPLPEGGPDWWRPRPVPPLRLGSGHHAIGPIEFAVAPGGSATVDLVALLRSAEAQGRNKAAREIARMAEGIVSGPGSTLPTPADADRREGGTPPPDGPPVEDDDRAFFLDFPTKERLLLTSLWQKGNVAIQKVLCAVWSAAPPKEPVDTLKKLMTRTNGRLAEKDYNLQVRQESQTLKLSSVDDIRPTFPRRK
jgi:hypothetical protein